jgi:hypothetical protein
MARLRLMCSARFPGTLPQNNMDLGMPSRRRLLRHLVDEVGSHLPVTEVSSTRKTGLRFLTCLWQ